MIDLAEAPNRPSVAVGESRRWLFFKERFAWPRASGHDVHTFFLMKALVELGHTVSLATNVEPPAEAIAGTIFANRYILDAPATPLPEPGTYPLLLTKSQEKFRSYWGISEDRIRKLAAAADDCRADVVVASGLNVLPYLGAIGTSKMRVWYAADEWVWHHLSMVRALKPATWSEIKAGIVKGLYERAYRKFLDRVWVVSQADAKAFRWFAGLNQTDILPNGVDAEHYAPNPMVVPAPNSCVFWGRLDFGPNIQAAEWFAHKVWPAVRAKVPDAQWHLYGFQPTASILKLAGKNGISLTADLPDIRPAVQAAQVVILPFVSGGGIKNKLLEAAAMGMPIVATARVKHGLNGTPPLAFAASPAEWVAKLVGLWADADGRRKLGAEARAWVVAEHTWAAAARTAAAGLVGEVRR